MSLIRFQTINPFSIIIRKKHEEYINILDMEKEICFLLFECDKIFADHPIIFYQLRKIIRENRCETNLLSSIHTLLLRLSRLAEHHDEKIKKIIAILQIITENTIKYCNPDYAFNTSTPLPTNFTNDVKDQIAQMDFSLHKEEIEYLQRLNENKFVYEPINDNSPNSAWGLFEDKFIVNSDDNLLESEQIKSQPYLLAKTDIKIIIPIFKVSYFGECFIEQSTDEQYPMTEFLSREVLVGGSLIIRNVENLVEFDKLKAQIVWAIKEASYSGKNIFKSAIVKNVEDSNGNPLHNMKDLINYITQIYEIRHHAVVAYEKMIPVNQIEDQDPYNYFDIRLIPGITDYHKEITIEHWIHGNIHLNLPFWIREYKLEYAKVVTDFKVKTGKKPALEFLSVPLIEWENNTELKISVLLNSKDYINYTCENPLRESEIPFLKLPRNAEVLSIHRRNENIISQCKIFHEKIIWEKQISKPSQVLIKDINNALDGERPYESLTKVFSEYGHVIRTEINISKNALHANQWDLLDKQKLIPLYEILDNDIKSRIQDLSTNKVLMKGYAKFSNKIQSRLVEFNRYMASGDYTVVGSVIANNEKLESLYATFKMIDPSGFIIFLHNVKTHNIKNNEESIEDFEVVWQVIGKPKNVGYFSKDNRDIKVLSAQSKFFRLPREKATYPVPPVYFEEELTPGSIIVTSIQYILHGGSILDVGVKSWSGKRIDLEVINHMVVDTTVKTKTRQQHEEIERSDDNDEDEEEKENEDENEDEEKYEDEEEDKNEEDKDEEDENEEDEETKEEKEDKKEEEKEVIYNEENRENFPYGFVRLVVLVYAIIPPNKQENFTVSNEEILVRSENKQFSWKQLGHELGETTIHIIESIYVKQTYSKYSIL
ncbi:hypothetical protein RclHR1_02760015 [Rhizophagus clarus]|uniref:Uncharacterized protein n=1 Tax=Rhizophagus clarus TaxID=94130 RepID=A0A2Z6R6H7_9GLOM|nr:hypothetical protein RclHR1_02760015 [Rhizophagus clarus]